MRRALSRRPPGGSGRRPTPLPRAAAAPSSRERDLTLVVSIERLRRERQERASRAALCERRGRVENVTPLYPRERPGGEAA